MLVAATDLLRGPLPLIVMAGLAVFFGVLVLMRGRPSGTPAKAGKAAQVERRRAALRLWKASQKLGTEHIEPLLENFALGEDAAAIDHLHGLATEAEAKAEFDRRFQARLAEMAKTPEGQAQLKSVVSPGGVSHVPTQ